MLTREQITAYCKEYLEAQALMREPPSKTMGLSMAMLLSVYFNYSDEEKAENVGAENLINGLKLAVVIDKKNIAKIDETAQLILNKLKPILAPAQMSTNFYAGTLDQAIAIIENNQIANNPKHVVRIFKAINIAENLSDEALDKKDILNIDLPREDNEDFRFYFHRENYSSIKERRAAINRLYTSILTIWNDSIENQELPYFLNSIQSGPCIEGATREPLVKTAARLQTFNTLRITYHEAMDLFYHQAVSVLAVIGLAPTLNIIKTLILNAYDGSKCIADHSPISLFSDSGVHSSLTELGYFNFRYHADSEIERVKINFPVSCCVATRLDWLSTLLPYAEPVSYQEIKTLKNIYSNLMKITTAKAEIHVTDYISDLQKIDPNKTPIVGSVYTALVWAIHSRYFELIEAILEFTDIDLKAPNYVDGTSIFVWLCTHGNQVLLSLLQQRNKFFLNQITVDDFRQPDAFGVTPFLLLIKSHRGVEILKKLIEINSKVFIEITADFICQSQPAGSVLYWLSNGETAQGIFEYMLDKNPQLILDITAKALCEWNLQNNNSPLLNIAMTTKGQTILTRLLDANSRLVAEIRDEDICKPNNNGISAFSNLVLNKVILRFLNNNRFAKLPVSFFANVLKAKTKVNVSNFSTLLFTDSGRQVLLYLLSNGNPILTQLAPKVFFRDVTREGVPTSDSFFVLADSKIGREILSILFASNSELLKSPLTASSLTHLHKLKKEVSSIYVLSTFALLSVFEYGCELLDTLLNQNPHIVITAADLCKPIGKENSQKFSVFSSLAATSKGREILVQLFNKNPKLVSSINREIITQPTERLISEDDLAAPDQQNLPALEHILKSKNDGLILHLARNPVLEPLFHASIKEKQEVLMSEWRGKFQNELDTNVNNLSLFITNTSSIKKGLLKIAEEKLKAVTTRTEIIEIEAYVKADKSSPAMSLFHRHRHEWFDKIRAKLLNQTEEDQYTGSYKSLLKLIENKKHSIEQADSGQVVLTNLTVRAST